MENEESREQRKESAADTKPALQNESITTNPSPLFSFPPIRVSLQRFRFQS